MVCLVLKKQIQEKSQGRILYYYSFFSSSPTKPVRAFLRTVFLHCLGPRAMDRPYFFSGTYFSAVLFCNLRLCIRIYLYLSISMSIFCLLFYYNRHNSARYRCPYLVLYGNGLSHSPIGIPSHRWFSAPPLIGRSSPVPGSPLPGTSEDEKKEQKSTMALSATNSSFYGS